MDGATPRWADILAMATAGEAVGFDTLWISDHLGFGDPAGEWSGAWESMTLLSALAVAVPRVRLGHVRHGDAAAQPGAAGEDGRDARRGQRRAVHPRPRRRLERARVHGVRRAVRAALRRVRGGPADHRRDVPRRARGPRRDLVAGTARADRAARSAAIGTADHDRDRRPADAPADRGARRRVERGHAPARRAAADRWRPSTRPVPPSGATPRRWRARPRPSSGRSTIPPAARPRSARSAARRPSSRPPCAGTASSGCPTSRSSCGPTGSRRWRRSGP